MVAQENALKVVPMVDTALYTHERNSPFQQGPGFASGGVLQGL